MVISPITQCFIKLCVETALQELRYCFPEQPLDILHPSNIRVAQKLLESALVLPLPQVFFFCPFLFPPFVCFYYTLFMEFTQDLGWYQPARSRAGFLGPIDIYLVNSTTIFPNNLYSSSESSLSNPFLTRNCCVRISIISFWLSLNPNVETVDLFSVP